MVRFPSYFYIVSCVILHDGCFASPLTVLCVCLSFLLASRQDHYASLSLVLASWVGSSCLLGWTHPTFPSCCVFHLHLFLFGGHWCTLRGWLRLHDGMDESTAHRKVRLHCATSDRLDVHVQANERMGRWDEVCLGGHGRVGTIGSWEKTSSWDTKDVRRHTRKRDVRDVVDDRTKERMRSLVDGSAARKLERATSCSAVRNKRGGTPCDQHNVDAKNDVHEAYDIKTKHTTRRTNGRSDAWTRVDLLDRGRGKANGEERWERSNVMACKVDR